jgi:uncharacterized membrane protein
MSLYETLLFLHVLGAFALVAGTMAMAPFALGFGSAALERLGSARLASSGAIMSGVGAVLTLVLGLWLVQKAGYDLLRFWILGALVLWAFAGYCNGQVSAVARKVVKGEDPGSNLRMLWYGDTLGAALLLVLMIWKPGH